MKSTLVLFTITLLASQIQGNLLDGLEHQHGEHGDHGHHGDHGEHGDHAHGEHAHGEHAHGEHGQGDEHNHNHDAAAVNQDPFATSLGGGFLSSLPAAGPASAPAETFVAPAEAFVAPAPASVPIDTFVAATPAPAPVPVPAEPFVAPVEEQQFVRQNSIQFSENEKSFDSSSSSFSSSSGQPKQLATAQEDISGRTGSGDFPEYATVPATSFSCSAQETGGYFADPEAQCQVFHICLNGQNLGSFLCPNGTLFHQQYFVCDWWFNVDCGAATSSYGLNAKIGVVPDSN